MGAIDCGYRFDLGVYALGSLTGTEATALRAHLPRCRTCRAELAELRAITTELARTRRSAGPPKRAGASLKLNGACVARGPEPSA